MVKSIYIILWLGLLLLTQSVTANNIRIVGAVKVDPLRIVSNVAVVELDVEWDHSWRDAMNYDAAYLFLKYKLTGEANAWHHLYLKDASHLVTTGYDYTLAKSTTTVDRNEGIFIYRSENNRTAGKSKVHLELKWLISGGTLALTRADFDRGLVEVSAMALEMVYVPRGAFRAGDGFAEKSFRQYYFPLPDKYAIPLERYRVESPEGDAKLAVNRVNDLYTSSWALSTTNAWIAPSAPLWWMVDFGTDQKGKATGEQKTIRYFGIEGHPSYVPNKWRLEGSNDVVNARWDTLYDSALDGKAGDWVTEMRRVYPVTHAVKLRRTGSYRYYRVYVETMRSGTPLIKSIAMTETDIDTLCDRSVLIWKPQTEMGTATASGCVEGSMLSASDGAAWSGTTSVNYPNGYGGFYVMKYELTQEQYVAFLNKLTYTQQFNIIGPLLTSYAEGQYIFGILKDESNFRNGIVIARHSVNGGRVLFANDLNKKDGYNEVGDGQTLGCNFVGIIDMLAYADWCGLRPLSELEYEKMCRRPYPYIPERGEYPWNSLKATLPTKIETGIAGEGTEKSDGNVNAGNKLGGPIRVGSFAVNAEGQETAGASPWGVMDLGGNLEEMYYNTNSNGLAFCGVDKANHGNGILPENAVSDVSGWPTALSAFVFRGGHFGTSVKELQSCNRYKSGTMYNAGSTLELRDSATCFRLGYTASFRTLTSVLTLQNKRTDIDTVCSGEEYVIQGDIPEGIIGDSVFVWFRSENRGTTWEEMEGANKKDLKVKKLLNQGTSAGAVAEYRFFRKMFMPEGDATSQTVAIRVINNSFQINKVRDTLYAGRSGFTATTINTACFTWRYQDSILKQELSTTSKYVPYWSDFLKKFEKNSQSAYAVELEVDFDRQCIWRQQINIDVPGFKYTVVTHPDGYRMWANGIYACSAKDYFDHSLNKDLTPLVSGTYRIDPDGPGGEAPYNAYCNMTSDGGGWTRFDDIRSSWHVSYTYGTYLDRVTNHARFVNLARISTQQKITAVQGNSYANSNNYYGWRTYNSSCVTNMWCDVYGNVNVGDVIVPINGNWTAAMYKSYYHYYNGGNGPYFSEMWFR